MLKAVETGAKVVLAWFAVLLLWRPGRRRVALDWLRAPKRILIVRIDPRVGEALLTTPLFRAAKALPSAPRVDVLVHPKMERVLRGLPSVDALIPFEPSQRAWGPFGATVRMLRRNRYDVVVNAASWTAPSVGPAIFARLAGPEAAVIGPDVSVVRGMFDVRVAPLSGERSEVRQRLNLLSPLGVSAEGGALEFRRTEPDAVVAAALERAGPRYAVVNPGGRLGERRLPAETFASAARALVEAGVTPLVTWGPGEEPLAKAVVEGAPSAVLAPPTTIDQLATLMARAQLTVCNNTGPMHLAVATGSPTLAFFLGMELERWGHRDPKHRMVDLTSVPDPSATAREVTAQFLRQRSDG